jgi:hypothetical protein
MKNLLLALSIVAVASCTRQTSDNPAADSNVVDNDSASVAKDEWTSLFNGSDLTGWRFYKNRQNNSWEVVDSVLHCKPFDNAEKETC